MSLCMRTRSAASLLSALEMGYSKRYPYDCLLVHSFMLSGGHEFHGQKMWFPGPQRYGVLNEELGEQLL